jgi:UDP-N-acetylglucosamine 4-epimerase
MEPIKLLITGGAGFIGSNLVEHFLQDDRVELVRVVDDLSNGYRENIAEFEHHPKFEFVEGDISQYEVCESVTRGIDVISHHAALGSVPRSIENPMRSTEVNVLGSVNILHAAVKHNVKRVILAGSSSTYGDHQTLPKVEHQFGNAMSPYGVTKLCMEQMVQVFHRIYGLEYILFRYFNVFGPRQQPDNPYAAVIPLFCKAYLNDESPTIYGDGSTTRDFTFVENVVHANELAVFTEKLEAINQVYNVACGEMVSLIEIIDQLKQLSGMSIDPILKPERAGDIKQSLADIQKIRTSLGYEPKVYFRDGLVKTYEYYKSSVMTPQ